MKRTYSVIIVTVCSVAFLSGILAGHLKNRTEQNINIPPKNISAAVNEEESVPENKKEPEYYQVKSEDDYICLYQCFSEGDREEIQKMNIKDIYLPDSELKELHNGVIFYDIEEALMVMESLSN